ncbi:MAG: site-specific integrase [Asgard group archaeon]|nr:site-specific integrase [Asgard group archaeon]
MINNDIVSFKDFLEIEQRSEHTIRQYMDILEWFKQYLDDEKVNYENLKENDITKFQLWLRKQRAIRAFIKEYNREPTIQELEKFRKETDALNGRSIYKYLAAIKKFLEVNDKQLNWTKIPSPKYDENFNPDVLSSNQIDKIAETAANYCTYLHKQISCIDCEKCKKYREPKNYKSSIQRIYPEVCFYFDGLKLKTMIYLAYEAALRTDELCDLRLKHLDLEKKEVFIEKPLKHSQPQAVPISNKLTKILIEYLNEINLSNKGEILFPTKMGKKYHANNFATHVFRPIAQEAGFDVRYYTLRHSRATNLIKQGLDIGWVRRITRHRNINNVLKYIHLSSQDIRNELEKRDIL